MADQAEAVIVDRRDLLDRVDAGEDVAQVAAAEIADVGAGEGLALAVAAARIGQELVIAGVGEVGAPAVQDESWACSRATGRRGR